MSELSGFCFCLFFCLCQPCCWQLNTASIWRHLFSPQQHFIAEKQNSFETENRAQCCCYTCSARCNEFGNVQPEMCTLTPLPLWPIQIFFFPGSYHLKRIVYVCFVSVQSDITNISYFFFQPFVIARLNILSSDLVAESCIVSMSWQKCLHDHYCCIYSLFYSYE